MLFYILLNIKVVIGWWLCNNFTDLPNWQKRGVGLYWETYEKQAMNPKLGIPVTTTRKRIKCELDLPLKDEYSQFLLNFVTQTDYKPPLTPP
jgi:hypothetical protein